MTLSQPSNPMAMKLKVMYPSIVVGGRWSLGVGCAAAEAGDRVGAGWAACVGEANGGTKATRTGGEEGGMDVLSAAVAVADNAAG